MSNINISITSANINQLANEQVSTNKNSKMNITNNYKINNNIDETSNINQEATLEISKEGKEAVQNNTNNYELYQQMINDIYENNKEAKEHPDDTWKILEIARRISRGDKVPPNDEKKLMEANFKLYQVAKSASVLNYAKKHKKYKSMYEEEDGLSEEMKEKIDSLNTSASSNIDSEHQVSDINTDINITD